MTIFGKILKKKREDIGEKKEKEDRLSVSTVPAVVKEASAKKVLVGGVLRSPHVTEKTSAIAAQNKYVFIVLRSVNKIEIRQAVEVNYGVVVQSVNVVNMPGKELRRGRQVGFKPGFKKAVVTLAEGQTIEIQ